MSSKLAIVVALFFYYILYVLSLALKHCLDKNGENESHRAWQAKAACFQKDMWARNSQVFLVLMLCSQIVPYGWTGVLAYFEIAALGVTMVGCFLQDNSKLRIVRQVGLTVSFLFGFMAIWTVIGHSWCGMFYFAKFFSQDVNQ